MATEATSVIDEVAQTLHCEAILHAAQKISEYRAKLENIISTDWDRVKADLESAAVHFEEEIKRLEGVVHPNVLAHLQSGAPAKAAVLAAKAGVTPEQLASGSGQAVMTQQQIVVP